MLNSIENKLPSYWTCPFTLTVVALITATIGATQLVPRNHLVHAANQDIKELKVVVSVTDKKGKPVVGLSQKAFQVLDGKIAQQITSFDTQDGPISVAIIFDISGMVDDRGRANKQARHILASLTQFIRSSHKSNEYFVIVGANREPRLLLNGVDDAEAAISGLNKISSWPRAGSADIMDALHLGITKASQGKYSKQTIIAVTNDSMMFWLGDMWAKHSFPEVATMVQGTGVLVYLLYVFPEDEPEFEIDSYRKRDAPRAIFQALADFSGGLHFPTQRSKQTSQYLERIATELRHQYIIGFRPMTAPKDGKCHSFKVKLMPATDSSYKTSSLTARNRKIYCPKL